MSIEEIMCKMAADSDEEFGVSYVLLRHHGKYTATVLSFGNSKDALRLCQRYI